MFLLFQAFEDAGYVGAKIGGPVAVFAASGASEYFTYNLVTSEEADAPNGKISTTSPIGRALVGKQVGDMVKVVTPSGAREFEIRKLTTIHDEG